MMRYDHDEDVFWGILQDTIGQERLGEGSIGWEDAEMWKDTSALSLVASVRNMNTLFLGSTPSHQTQLSYLISSHCWFVVSFVFSLQLYPSSL